MLARRPSHKNTELTGAEKANIKNTYGKLPLYFIENKGQVDKQVSFYERGAGHATFFTSEGVVISLTKKDGKSEKASFKKDVLGLETGKSEKTTSEAMTLRYAHLAPEHKSRAVRVLDVADGYNIATLFERKKGATS